MKGRLKATTVAVAAALALLATGSGAADSAPTCMGEKATIIGTDGDDLIAGTGKDDVIVTFAGNDVINAHDGDDLVCAGDGNDRIDGGDGFFDGIDGGAGDDWIDGGDAAFTFAIYDDSPGPVTADLVARTVTGDGADTLANVNSLIGSQYDDVLKGDGQLNLIVGGDGNDSISARGFTDLLSGDAGDDVIDGGPGRDEVSYYESPRGVVVNLATGKAVGWGADRLQHVEDAEGSRLDDRLLGNSAVNRLEGAGGADRLIGLGNNDVLTGIGGRDFADGGRGHDRCAAERRIRCP
jgi:Ca2+-binding RTX toxin-like protein